jgi:hypothetical protein
MMVFAAPADEHRVTRIYARAGAAVVVALGLAGCGLSHPAAPALSPTASSQLALAHPSARAMYHDMTRALRRVHSVSVAAHIRLNHGPETTITYSLQVPGRAQATIQQGNRVINERYVGHMVYFRYNYGSLLALSGGDSDFATVYGERWIGLPDSKVPLSDSLRYMVAHKRVQECDVLGPSGHLTVGPMAMVNGLPTVSLQDHGGLPGTAPRQIAISSNPPYLPLEIRQTKQGKPGGTTIKDCVTQRDQPTLRRMVAVSRKLDAKDHLRLKSYTQTIDHYNFPLHLVAPPHPVLPDAQAAGTAGDVAL